MEFTIKLLERKIEEFKDTEDCISSVSMTCFNLNNYKMRILEMKKAIKILKAENNTGS